MDQCSIIVYLLWLFFHFPSSLDLFISESVIHRGQTILRTIFILFGDVPSSKYSTACISRFFRSSVPLFFGPMILGESNSRSG